MTRVVVVDLLCNSPYYCGPLVAALRAEGVLAELASPAFYLEPDFLAAYPVAPWITNLTVRVARPRPLRLASRTIEVALNGLRLLWRINRRRYDVVHVQWMPFDHRQTVGMRLLRTVCDRAGARLVFTAHNVLPHDGGGADPAMVRRKPELRPPGCRPDAPCGPRAPDSDPDAVADVEIPHRPLFVDRRSGSGGRRRALGLAAGSDGPVPRPPATVQGSGPPRGGVAPGSRCVSRGAAAVVGKVLDTGVWPELDRLRALPRVQIVDRYVSVARMLDSYAVARVVVFPYRRISQSGALMTAAGVGRPSVITPLDGLVEQVRRFASAVVATEMTGPALARALIDGIERAPALLLAAADDRAALTASDAGWAAIAAATRRAYEDLPVSPPR